jgi:CheY-like chemotaxis protein
MAYEMHLVLRTTEGPDAAERFLDWPMLTATHATANDIPPAQTTILVVEDEAFVREPACDILEGEGYRVLRAHDAAEAHAAFQRQQGTVQLLLLDVVLPGQQGPALAKELQTTFPALKAVFISGWPSGAATRYDIAVGQTSFLAKPFSAESLLRKVRQALQSEQETVGGQRG